MPHKPDLPEEIIKTCLQAAYGLLINTIEFLPLGYDSEAGVYRIEDRDQACFLKVKRNDGDGPGILLPHYLKQQGIERVISPLPTVDGNLCTHVGPYTLVLYPFIEGTSGWTTGLTDDQWVELGVILKRLHSIELRDKLYNVIPEENFVPNPQVIDVINQLMAMLPSQSHQDPSARVLAAFWRENEHEIKTIVDRTMYLGTLLQDKAVERVLCHADIHTANLLITPHNQFFIVDWDEAILAPCECDLLFVTVGEYMTETRHEALFREGYGEVTINPLILAYYRYKRALEDLSSFAEDVFLREGDSATRQDSMEWFMRQFAPGGGVEVAHWLDKQLGL